MLGDEFEDLRLDLRGFNAPDGDLVRGGECKGGKGTAMGDTSWEEEPSSSLKWKVGRLWLRRGSAPREVNAPLSCERTEDIVGCKTQNTSIICTDSISISGSISFYLLTPLRSNNTFLCHLICYINEFDLIVERSTIVRSYY